MRANRAKAALALKPGYIHPPLACPQIQRHPTYLAGRERFLRRLALGRCARGLNVRVGSFSVVWPRTEDSLSPYNRHRHRPVGIKSNNSTNRDRRQFHCCSTASHELRRSALLEQAGEQVGLAPEFQFVEVAFDTFRRAVTNVCL